jgi:parallel beta-helix repeat protein
MLIEGEKTSRKAISIMLTTFLVINMLISFPIVKADPLVVDAGQDSHGNSLQIGPPTSISAVIQNFRPSKSHIEKIEVYFNKDTSDDILVGVATGTSNPMFLSYQETRVFGGWNTFDAVELDVIPGNLYNIMIVTSTVSAQVGFQTGDLYKQGVMCYFENGELIAKQDWDMAFKVWGYNSNSRPAKPVVETPGEDQVFYVSPGETVDVDLSVSVVDPDGDDVVYRFWDADSGDVLDTTGYFASGETVTYTWEGLVPGSYGFYVRAGDFDGFGEASSVCSFVVEERSSDGVWYVDDDNTGGPWDGSEEHPFQNIQDAVNIASNEDIIIVYSGDYEENLVLKKTLTIKGEEKASQGFPTVKSKKWGKDVIKIEENNCQLENFNIEDDVTISSDNNTIKNCVIHSVCYCLFLSSSNNNVISKNEISGETPVNLVSSCNNVFSENYIHGGSAYIIEIEDNSNENYFYKNTIAAGGQTGVGLVSNSASNKFEENTISAKHGDGLELSSSPNTIVINNDFNNCGLKITGVSLEYWTTHLIEGNTINKKSMMYRVNQNGFSLSGNFGQIIIANCHEATIENIIISSIDTGMQIGFCSNLKIQKNRIYSSSYDGIYITESSDIKILENTLSDNYNGICLENSNKCNITKNILNNNEIGIYLKLSNLNEISGNKAFEGMHGVALEYSDDNEIFENDVSFCSDSCLFLLYSRKNIVKKNSFYNSDGNGISLLGFFGPTSYNEIKYNRITNNYVGIGFGSYTAENTISNNNIASNKMGIYIHWESNSNNRIFYNNFINNEINGYIESKSKLSNYWDDGEGKGNYWDDYEKRYPDANKINGIWDIPYTVGEGNKNKDNYPVVNRFNLAKGKTKNSFLDQQKKSSNTKVLEQLLEKYPLLNRIIQKSAIIKMLNITIPNIFSSFLYHLKNSL